jgi:DNA-binding CsgD family transcriptional regulator
LFVSPETIKTHLKHLYKKLGVDNRREAAAMAAEIISPRAAH